MIESAFVVQTFCGWVSWLKSCAVTRIGSGGATFTSAKDLSLLLRPFIHAVKRSFSSNLRSPFVNWFLCVCHRRVKHRSEPAFERTCFDTIQSIAKRRISELRWFSLEKIETILDAGAISPSFKLWTVCSRINRCRCSNRGCIQNFWEWIHFSVSPPPEVETWCLSRFH